MFFKLLCSKYRSNSFWRYGITISFCLLMFCAPKTALAQDMHEPVQTMDTITIQGGDSLLVKSESRAFRSSLLGTIAPLPTLILTIPGIIVGPSLGYFYGGMPGRAWKGIGLRVVGIGGMIGSLLYCWNCGPETDYTIAWIVLLSSAGIVVISAVHDIASIKKAIRKKNASIPNIGLTLAPRYFVHTKSVGLALSYKF